MTPMLSNGNMNRLLKQMSLIVSTELQQIAIDIIERYDDELNQDKPVKYIKLKEEFKYGSQMAQQQQQMCMNNQMHVNNMVNVRSEINTNSNNSMNTKSAISSQQKSSSVVNSNGQFKPSNKLGIMNPLNLLNSLENPRELKISSEYSSLKSTFTNPNQNTIFSNTGDRY